MFKLLNNLKQAFTLIEIMIVVAIVAALSGVILVGINKTTQSGQFAKAQLFSVSLLSSLSDNVVSEWKLDDGPPESSGYTFAYDTWDENTATLMNFAFDASDGWRGGSQCVSNNCLQFDGVNDYMTASAISLPVFTIEAWVKPATTQTGSASIVSDVYPPKVNYKIGFVGGTLNVTGGIYLSTWYDTPQITLTANTWSHIAFSYNGTAMAIYLNGALKGTTNVSIIPSSSGTALNIGKRWDAAECFNGSMDTVRIYSAAIPVSQIKDEYYSGLNNLLAKKDISAKEYSERINEAH